MKRIKFEIYHNLLYFYNISDEAFDEHTEFGKAIPVSFKNKERLANSAWDILSEITEQQDSFECWLSDIEVDHDLSYIPKSHPVFVKIEDIETNAEEIFEMVSQLIDTGDYGLCIIDSLGAMVSQQEMEKTIEDSTYGGISRALTKFSKKIETVCAKTNCALIGINQVRDNLNAGYGGPTTVTPGGRCWKHSCSVRLQFRQGTPFDESFKDLAKKADSRNDHQQVQ